MGKEFMHRFIAVWGRILLLQFMKLVKTNL